MEKKLRRMNVNPPDLEENLVKSNDPVLPKLPNELFRAITKLLRDEDCVALALSGTVKGFADFYRLNRKHVMSNKCDFLTPSVWSDHFSCHICPATVTAFNVNHLYWLPADLLADAITKLTNLEELSVKDTEISLPILANVLNTCSEITKLDFSFRFEKGWKNLPDSLKKVTQDSFVVNLKRITCLKMSTCVLDARDYRHDPWQPILLFLSMCRDCVELGVEITYSGRDFKYPSTFPYVNPEDQFKDLRQFIRETFYPHLGWMTSLQSLVLTKLGDFLTSSGDFGTVESFMLDDLLTWLFSEDDERVPGSLRHLWIQDFQFRLGYQSTDSSAQTLVSYQLRDSHEAMKGPEPFSQFPKLEYASQLKFCEDYSPLHLPTNVKYVQGECCCPNGENYLNNFIRTHPNLEYLSVDFFETDDVFNREWKLPKLKVLKYSREFIDKEIIDTLTKVYSNVESLCLENKRNNEALATDQECLSSIKFERLTTLSLMDFRLGDGAFLLPVIKQCRKLQSLDLSGTNVITTAFVSNLDLFLPLATNLCDFRLECPFKGDGSLILPLLKSFLKHSPKLKRLVLMDRRADDSLLYWVHPSEMSDVIIRFALKMPRLVALCIVFFRLTSDVIEEVNRRITEEVLPSKPSLWFCLNNSEPNPTNSTVPFIHYQQMVSPLPFWASPEVDLFTDL